MKRRSFLKRLAAATAGAAALPAATETGLALPPAEPMLVSALAPKKRHTCRLATEDGWVIECGCAPENTEHSVFTTKEWEASRRAEQEAWNKAHIFHGKGRR